MPDHSSRPLVPAYPSPGPNSRWAGAFARGFGLGRFLFAKA